MLGLVVAELNCAVCVCVCFVVDQGNNSTLLDIAPREVYVYSWVNAPCTLWTTA